MIVQLRRALMQKFFGRLQNFIIVNFGKKQRIRLPEGTSDSFELHLSAFKGPMP